MPTPLRVLFGASSMAIGLFLAAAEGFLLAWEAAAGGERDIAARGGFLLGLYLPEILAGVAVIVVATVHLLRRRRGDRPWRSALLALLAVLASFAVVFLGPVPVLLRPVIGLPPMARPVAVVLICVLLLAFGIVLVRPRPGAAAGT